IYSASAWKHGGQNLTTVCVCVCVCVCVLRALQTSQEDESELSAACTVEGRLGVDNPVSTQNPINVTTA
ncbi:MAG: hypothetical protein MK102_15550, partial [Fuerstiella sp.]|nr:hypothetical protein [Fuerstiella sp.]